MKLKVEQLDEKQISQLVAERLKEAKDFRSTFEPQWLENESILYNAVGYREMYADVTPEQDITPDPEFNDNLDVGVNYVFKNWRFLHAQMSANPPSVIISATSPDREDRLSSRLADKTARYLKDHHTMQEKQDRSTAKTLSKGTGWMKTIHDPMKGKIRKFNQKTNEIEMTGDISATSPSTWDVWVDPQAKEYEDECRYVFERHWLPVKEAIFLFPDQADKFKTQTKRGAVKQFFKGVTASTASDKTKELVEIYEYYEKGLPINGMAGRHVWHLEDGTLLRPTEANPHPGALLPYHPLTDIDVEDQIYGKSHIEYAVPSQDVINRSDGALLDNVKLHGKATLAQPENCTVADGSLTDSADVVLKYTGNQAPHYLTPPGTMPDMVRLRTILQQGIDTLGGVNETMFGEVKREMSGFSMQTAINAGNLVRRRLFNKYALWIKRIYEHLLMLVIMHWDDKRMIKVSGREGALEIAYLKGSDIESGWDLTTDYGTSLSLDPASRREEIMQMQPLLEKAGFSARQILGFIRLNETAAVYDRAEMSKDRQREIIDVMVAKYDMGTPVYIAPEELQEHEAMLEYCYDYMATADFRDLPNELKDFIRRHVKERRQLALQEAQPPPAAAGGVPGMPAPVQGPAPAAPAAPGGAPQPAPPA